MTSSKVATQAATESKAEAHKSDPVSTGTYKSSKDSLHQPMVQLTSGLPRGALSLIIHSFLSFVICNLDRINLSVAIIPMAKLFGWSASRQGIIQSIFFLGYMTTQVLGGRLADARGGRFLLAFGVFIWSLCTAFIPPSAPFLPVLLIVRVGLGAGEGVAMPAMNQLISAAVPPQFRARALAFIYSGMYVGSIVGLLVTPVLLKIADYRAAFYVFAAFGVLWVLLFLATTSEPRHITDFQQSTSLSDYSALVVPPADDKCNVNSNAQVGAPQEVSDKSQNDSSACLLSSDSDVETGASSSSLSNDRFVQPTFREIFSHRAIWAIIVAHFCCTWGYFVLLAWLPSYLYMRFNLNVSASAIFSTLPWVAMFIASNIGGVLADGMLAHGMDTTRVRKIMQGIGFVGPAAFLTALSFVTNANVAIVCIATALATSAFSQSGVYANHQDIGPHIAGTLLGISSTFASVPGLVGVYVTGIVLDLTSHNWDAVFAMAVFFYSLGFVVYTALATSNRIW